MNQPSCSWTHPSCSWIHLFCSWIIISLLLLHIL
jgi:hypothetical protein